MYSTFPPLYHKSDFRLQCRGIDIKANNNNNNKTSQYRPDVITGG